MENVTSTPPVVPARPEIPNDEFHIGITMAGAASAGCYTGGVMDYLFEMLDLWEKAKKRELPKEWGTIIYDYVPQHKVIIDAMGGTSAGGMTTVMSGIYALKGKINPVTDPGDKSKKKNNLLYDSWVLMNDEEDGPKVLEKAFITDDLDSTKKIQSLLNSDFIDAICDNAFKDDLKYKERPAYISKELEIILAHTMLRSVALAIDFTTQFGSLKASNSNPTHNTFDHFTVSHYKLNYNEEIDKNKYLHFDPFGESASLLKLTTKATGAFPIGLRFREFFKDELPAAYIQYTSEKIVSPDSSQMISPFRWPANFPNPFSFVSIDGGAINNEPFGEVLGVLKRKYGLKKFGEPQQYALIMIDPFPDVAPTGAYKQPDDLFSIVPAIIGTLWDQSKVKRAEMLDAYSNSYYRGEIYPKRYTYDPQQKKYIDEPYPIACGAAMAFGGFLDIDFRHHDFFLGRDNAKNFFRVYFSCEYDPQNVHPIHSTWTDPMIEKFKFQRDGKTFLPIIPDMHLLKSKLDGNKTNPYAQIVNAWPQYEGKKLFALKDKMKSRFEKMLELSYKKVTTKNDKDNPQTANRINEYDDGNWLKKQWKRFSRWVGSGVLRFLFNATKGKIANRITKLATEWILKDLEKRGLLK